MNTFLYSIGRIDLISGKGVGTGFLISKSLLVTNKHVLDVLSYGTNRLEKGQAIVRFREEYNSRTEPPVAITEAVAQLRRSAGARQVAGAEIALLHAQGGILSSHATLILGQSA